MSANPKLDVQTVTVDGQPIQKLIHGVNIQPPIHVDDRGTLCEILTPHRPPHPGPLVYVYQFTIRPGKIKGGQAHPLHNDQSPDVYRFPLDGDQISYRFDDRQGW